MTLQLTYDRLIELFLVFMLVFTPLAYGAVHPSSIAFFEIIAALMAMLWIFKMLSLGRLEFVRNPIIPCIFLFIGYVFSQYLFSQLPTSNSQLLTPSSIYPWATKTEILKLISYSMIFFVTLNTLRTKRQITRVLSVIIIMGFLMSIFYLMRYFGAPAPAGFINPDHFSAYLGMIIPLSLGFLFVGNTASLVIARSLSTTLRATKQSSPLSLLFFTIIIMSAALFFTMSRGGMFSFVAALVFIALLVSTRRSMQNKGWLILAITVFIILIIVWLGATPVVERILSFKAEIASRYFGGRLPIWQGTLNIIKDYPIFGTGLATFNYIFPKYQPLSIINKHYTYAHSDFLELLSEIGIVGFALAVVCGLWTVVYLFRRFRQRHDPWVTGISVCVFGSLTAIFIHSFTDFNLHISANAVLLAVILALFISILKVNKSETTVSVIAGRPKADEAILYNIRTTRYPIAILLAGLLVIYMIAVIRPAMADHYASLRGSDLSSEAISLSRAIRLDPSNADYHYKLGKLYGKSRKYSLQLVKYQDAVSLNPTNSQYHQSLAWTYGQLADLDDRPDPSLPEAKRSVSLRGAKRRSNLSTEDYTQNAITRFEVAIELNPNYYYPYQVYAVWLFNHATDENIKKAYTEYKDAMKLKPDLAEEFVKNYSGYFKNYEDLIDILPQTEEKDSILFALLLKEKGLKFAIDFAERFFKSYPHNAALHFCIADASFYDKNYPWEFTEQHYKIAFKNDPGNAFYRLWHGIHLYLRRDYKAAVTDLEASLKMNPDPASAEEAKKHIAKCNANIQR